MDPDECEAYEAYLAGADVVDSSPETSFCDSDSDDE
jgi:hypothetical protein